MTVGYLSERGSRTCQAISRKLIGHSFKQLIFCFNGCLAHGFPDFSLQVQFRESLSLR
jgi:hypothetical protein